MLLLPQGIRGDNQNQIPGWNHSLNTSTTLCWFLILELMSFHQNQWGLDLLHQNSHALPLVAHSRAGGNLNLSSAHMLNQAASASETGFYYQPHIAALIHLFPVTRTASQDIWLRCITALLHPGLCFASSTHVWVSAMRSVLLPLKPLGSRGLLNNHFLSPFILTPNRPFIMEIKEENNRSSKLYSSRKISKERNSTFCISSVLPACMCSSHARVLWE